MMAAKLNEEMAPIDRLRIGAATAASVRRADDAPRRKIHVVDLIRATDGVAMTVGQW